MNKPVKSENSIFHKVIRGGSWVLALRFVEKGLSTVKIIILARILSPNDLGLFGIALLTLSILEAFSQTGFNTALIQKKGDTKGYLNSAWSMSALRGLILFSLLYFLAPYASIFFNAPESSYIIRVLSFSVVLKGFNNIGLIYFQKELKFKKIFVSNSVPTIIEFVTVVSFAFILRNVWSLVIGQLIGSVTALIAGYLIHPFRPKINIEIKKIKELFSFGKWIMWSTILFFFITQGDDIFVARFLGITALAFYQLAFRIANIPTTEIAHVFSMVTFPAYSKIQDNLPRLQESYLRVLQLVAFLSFPISGFILVLAPEFTTIFLGEKWLDIVPTMQVLVVAGMVRSIAHTAAPIFIAVGKPQIDTKLSIVRLLIIAIIIYPLSVKFNILGVSIAVVVSIFVVNFGFLYNVLKVTKCDINNIFKAIRFSFFNALILVVTISLLKKIFLINSTFTFLLYVCIGIFMYLSTTYFFDKYQNHKIRHLVLDCLYSMRNR